MSAAIVSAACSWAAGSGGLVIPGRSCVAWRWPAGWRSRTAGCVRGRGVRIRRGHGTGGNERVLASTSPRVVSCTCGRSGDRRRHGGAPAPSGRPAPATRRPGTSSAPGLPRLLPPRHHAGDLPGRSGPAASPTRPARRGSDQGLTPSAAALVSAGGFDRLHNLARRPAKAMPPSIAALSTPVDRSWRRCRRMTCRGRRGGWKRWRAAACSGVGQDLPSGLSWLLGWLACHGGPMRCRVAARGSRCWLARPGVSPAPLNPVALEHVQDLDSPKQ